ncbi:MAG: hypothetical protein M3O09_19395 [Acidobacteriota bacterium]|nr:hypothetical protein [Acidobacteriota bacterium]
MSDYAENLAHEQGMSDQGDEMSEKEFSELLTQQRSGQHPGYRDKQSGMKLERKLDILPAYDKVKEGYGVHGVEMRWYVTGPKGAIQFVLYTNWQLKHIQKKFDNRVNENDSRFTHLFCHPQPADIGYHSYVPHYEGHTPMSKECHLLKGPCYYGGSSLNAQIYYDILVERGGDALWDALEDKYKEWLD